MASKEEETLQLLDVLYEKVQSGVPRVSDPIHHIAEDYLEKNNQNVERAAKSFIRYQIAKCTTSGFLTGLGGALTLPVAVSANVSSVLYVQMRMAVGIAYMGGYEINSDQVRTLVYVCIAGVSVNQVLKNAGIQIGTKLSMSMVKKIPGTILTKINQKVGFRMVTKLGSKGVINFGKTVPFMGGVIGGGFDLAETRVIADRASKLFIEGKIDY